MLENARATGGGIDTEAAAAAAGLDGTRFVVLAGAVACWDGPARTEGPVCGHDIGACLEAQLGVCLGRGLYTHLDALVEAGLIDKGPAPGTRNCYRPTADGIDVVRGAAAWLAWVTSSGERDAPGLEYTGR